MFIAACAPQASGFDTQRGRWAFAGESGKARCTPPSRPRPNFPRRRQTALAIDPLFSLASVSSNSEETSQSRLRRVSLASKEKWQVSICRNEKYCWNEKTQRNPKQGPRLSRVQVSRQLPPAQQVPKEKRERGQTTRPLTSSKPRGCCLSVSNS